MITASPKSRTLTASLDRLVEDDGDRCFVRTADAEVSRGELWASCRRLAAGLQSIGVRRGDTVAIMADNRLEFIETWFAVAAAGAIEVPVNPALVGRGLAHVIDHSQARTLVVEGRHLVAIADVADALPHLETLVVIDSAGAEVPPPLRLLRVLDFTQLDVDEPAQLAALSAADPVAVMYTSGSTGPAKGVVVPHGQHHTNGTQPTSLFGIGEDDVVHVCLPLHHNMAQGYGVWPALVSGASVSLSPRFDPETFWDELRAGGATVLPIVGAMLALLDKRAADDESSDLRIGYGVPIPSDLQARMQARLGCRLVHCYGSTEATIVTWADDPASPPGCTGRPLPDFEVAIHDVDDAECPTGDTGEICVRPKRPDSMFSGYFRDAERTADAWRNLWFHTGDRGRFDEDGFMWFVDRTGDVIRRMGEFISSSEVENVLQEHPDVVLAAAFGVESELVEQEVMVSVQPRPASTVTAAELRDWCAGRLPQFAVPRFVDIVDELPMTATGKVEKFRLRERGVTDATDDRRKGRDA